MAVINYIGQDGVTISLMNLDGTGHTSNNG